MFLGIHREDDADLSSDDSSTPQIKRGLSKFYKGKSQSYTSISDVTCVEDLAKKRDPLNRTKSYAGGLDGDEVSSSSSSSRPPCSSKGKGSRVSCASSVARSSRPPAVPVQHNF